MTSVLRKLDCGHIFCYTRHRIKDIIRLYIVIPVFFIFFICIFLSLFSYLCIFHLLCLCIFHFLCLFIFFLANCHELASWSPAVADRCVWKFLVWRNVLSGLSQIQSLVKCYPSTYCNKWITTITVTKIEMCSLDSVFGGDNISIQWKTMIIRPGMCSLDLVKFGLWWIGNKWIATITITKIEMCSLDSVFGGDNFSKQWKNSDYKNRNVFSGFSQFQSLVETTCSLVPSNLFRLIV